MYRLKTTLIISVMVLLVLGCWALSAAREKPVVEPSKVRISPTATIPGPDPNWDLKPVERQPDYHELNLENPMSKVAPNTASSGTKELKSSVLAEDFEVSVPPAGWSLISTHTDTLTWYQAASGYSGSYHADVKYDPALVPQDEWLVTSAMDFTSVTADIKVDFYWMMSYYWGVSPYDNYDIELWISTDGGATWSTKLWDESVAGVFSNFLWYSASVSLAGYVGQSNVKLAWRYVGADGAQAGVDFVSINDDPPPTGRCCYGDPFSPSCSDVSQAECATLGGTWDITKTCAEPCPIAGPGDNCAAPVVVNLPAEMPYLNTNYTCGRLDDYNATCLGSYDGGEDIIYQLNVTSAIDVDITLDPKGTTWTGILVDDACPPDGATCLATHTSSGGTIHGIYGLHLEPGTYFVMIDTYPTPDCVPDFTLEIKPVSAGNPGDDCSNPLSFKLPEDMINDTLVDSNWTCGRIDNYNNTCLGSYDGGEDIIYELDVSTTMVVDIKLNPLGTTYTGIAIHNTCPLDATTCLAKSTNYGSGIHGITGLTLDPGLYYIMIDTWPSPACIPAFKMTITGAAPAPENDPWDKAAEIGDVTNLPFSTTSATFDGPGGCLTSANLWYCYTASCTGDITVSLCGSGFDTKLAVYDGCGDPATSTQIACNDDYCSTQSQVKFPGVAGNTYLIEVGGYSNYTGDGVLSTSCVVGCPPPPNDNCGDVTPAALTMNVTHTFTGNNCGATNDCSLLTDNGHAWEAFTVSEKADVIVDYCGTSPAFELVYIVLATACPCEGGSLIYAVTTDWNLCGGDGNITMNFKGLDPGTYYIPVLSNHPDYPDNYYSGPYTINVLATPWVAAYCDASGGCDEYISNVTVAEINNSSACDGYADYTGGQAATMSLNVGYPISITNGNPYSSDYAGVWVDWNQDFDFDDAGEAITLSVSSGVGPYTGTITPPPTAMSGTTRMRVRIVYSSTPVPCGVSSYGEAEDYAVNVSGGSSTFTYDPTAIDFGKVLPDATGGSTLTLGAQGEYPINYSVAISYGKKASVGGASAAADLKKSPVRSGGYTPLHSKTAKQLLFEGFEGGVVPPTGWAAVVNNPFTWQIGSYDPYEGTYNADCMYDETYTGSQNEWLVSPTIDFGGGKYVLDFWWLGSYYWSVSPYSNCTLSVWISVNGGTTYPVKLWDQFDYGVFTNWVWNNSIVDLSAYKNESNVKLAFVYTGYDGAQFSLDAIGLNSAPLSWLSAVPATGTIPGNGTHPVAVNYDATGLDVGVYNADLTITHTGLKGVATIPVTMEVALGGDSIVMIDPYPIYAFMQSSIEDSMVAEIYMGGEFAGGGHNVEEIDLPTVQINGTLAPTSTEILTGYENFTGKVLLIKVNMQDFILSYPILWDTSYQDFTISGMFTDGPTPFTQNGGVTMIGHKSGDVNFDGRINALDITYLINFLYKSGPQPRPILQVGDTNGDGRINALDITRLINFLYKHGPAPTHP